MTFETTDPPAWADTEIPPSPEAVKYAIDLAESDEPMATPTDFVTLRSTDNALISNNALFNKEISNAETSTLTSVSSVAEIVIPSAAELSRCVPAPIATRDVDETVSVATNKRRFSVFDAKFALELVTMLMEPASIVTPSATEIFAATDTICELSGAIPVKFEVPETKAVAPRLTTPVAKIELATVIVLDAEAEPY